jgi:hypothetical protein
MLIFREERLVLFNFMLIYSVAILTYTRDSGRNSLKGMPK